MTPRVGLGIALWLALAACGGARGDADATADSGGAHDAAGHDDAARAADAAPRDAAGDARSDARADVDPQSCVPPGGIPTYGPFQSDELTIHALDANPALANERYCINARDCGTGDPVPDHFSRIVIPRDRPIRPQLFVYLNGSGGTCRTAQHITHMAAFAGFRALCLGYTTEVSLADYCRDSGDDACHAGVRDEIVRGVDGSPLLTIGRGNSIEGRLVSLLTALHARRPSAGFDAYLNGTSPRWDRIVISGFSQGGGHAGWISRGNLVARAVFFSKGADGVGEALGPCGAGGTCARGMCEMGTCYALVPVAWARDARVTPPSREYGFVHRRESAYFYSPDTWRLWGMDAWGDLVDVDNSRAPHGCAHMFVTNVEPAMPGDFHRSMAGDPWIAVDAQGRPVNSPTYLTMFMAGW